MNIVPIATSANFQAELYTYPKTITNKKIFTEFAEKTKEYPSLALLQDDISFVGDDHFFLLEKNKVLNFKPMPYTKNRAQYQTVDQIVNRFVEIFHILRKGK